MKCPKCHTSNILQECIEEDNWNLPPEDAKYYLKELVNIGFCISKRLGICFDCMDSREIDLISAGNIHSLSKTDLQKYILEFHCRKCRRFYDVTEAYFIREDVRKIWNEDGTWLEWYMKNILRKHQPDANLEHGLILIDRERTIQVDLMLMTDGKIMTFECKAKKTGERASFEEVSSVLKLLDFSDESFLVTTGRIAENDKKNLSSIGKEKLTIVESPDLEKILRTR